MRIAATIFAVMLMAVATRTWAQSDAELEIGGGKIEIEFASAPSVALRKLILDWVTSSARAVTAYYKQFPVAHVQIRIRFFDGHGVRSGRTIGWNGASIT